MAFAAAAACESRNRRCSSKIPSILPSSGRPSLLAIKQVTAAPQKKTEKNSADSGFAER